MIFKVLLVICFSTAYAAIAPGQNAYLPPKQPGYNYNKPNIPFPSPPGPRPTPPSRPIPPTRPTYGPPKPPGPTPPPFRPTPAPQRPTYRPTQPQRPPQTPGYPAIRPTYPPAQRPSPPGPPTIPSGTDHHDHHVHMPGMPFDFNYAVKDDQFGNDYSHNAISDGDVTKGEYRIQLPDGRTQIVKYTADWKTGFHAQVKFEGTPNYQNRPSIPRPNQPFPPSGPAQPPTGPSRPFPPSGPARPPTFPSGPARPAPGIPSRPGQGYPSGPRPTPTFPSPPSRPNQIPGQKYDTNGGYKY